MDLAGPAGILMRRRAGDSGSGAMDWFIRQQNLERFRRLLTQSADESERRQLLKLLAEEETKERATLARPGGAVA
jgi:hypothetical protein